MTKTVSEIAPELLAAHVAAAMPRDTWPFWFDGWPGEIEAALLDAVFSARASYGSETTGVRKVVGAWRAHRGETLDRIAAFEELTAAELLDALGNRQRVTNKGATKAEAVRSAAFALRDAGVESSADVDGSEAQRVAFTSVTGLGTVSWECFLAVLGLTTFDSDALVSEYVRTAIEADHLEDVDVEGVLAGAATLLETSTTTLRHAVWRYQRKQNRMPRADSSAA